MVASDADLVSLDRFVSSPHVGLNVILRRLAGFHLMSDENLMS
jgi:hypothetical protein